MVFLFCRVNSKGDNTHFAVFTTGKDNYRTQHTVLKTKRRVSF